MKKTLSAILVGISLISCMVTKAQDTKLKPESPEYQLAKDLTTIDALYDPDKNVAFVTTNLFNVTIADLMVYAQGSLGNSTGMLKQYEKDMLKQTMKRLAVQIAERRLIVTSATRAGVKLSDDETSKAYEEQYSQSGGEAQFKEQLAQNGVQLEFVKKMIAETKLIQKYFDTKVFAEIKVSEADLKKAYESDKTATVRHILLMTQNKTDAEKKEIRTKMEGILARAKKGEDFAALAKEFTEDPGSKETGGLYENFGKGEMVKAFEDAAFSVAIGKISDIVETEYGFHILKVEGRQKETLPFDQVKAALTESMTNQRKSSTYEKFMSDMKSRATFTEVKL